MTWAEGRVWRAGVLGGATWGFVPPRLANWCAEAEKAATAVPGGPGWKEAGARCYLLIR